MLSNDQLLACAAWGRAGTLYCTTAPHICEPQHDARSARCRCWTAPLPRPRSDRVRTCIGRSRGLIINLPNPRGRFEERRPEQELSACTGTFKHCITRQHAIQAEHGYQLNHFI